MGFNRFRFHIIGRVFILCIFLYAFLFLLIHTTLYATTILTGLCTLFIIYSLIRFVEKSNRSLVRFFESIKYSDFSQTFTVDGHDKTLDELHEEFNGIMEVIHRERDEKETQRHFLETIVQHVGIGLISYRPDGTVELINTAAKRLLGVSHLKSVQLLETFSPELSVTLMNLAPGDKRIVKVSDNNEILQLAVYATEYMLRENRYTLVSIQNIQNELEEQEMKAWQNLIRVLTHEIMNSVTPIASLAATANSLLLDVGIPETAEPAQSDAEENISDIKNAVDTIQKRSEGLLHFVENYRNLTRVPIPDFKVFAVSELFANVYNLMKTRIEENRIEFTVSVEPESLELTADAELIEQVLINLLKNAIEAVSGRDGARIVLEAKIDARGRNLVSLSDNGPGIVAEAIDKVFIPFFTTKQDGSGIGLSLSRQIMRLHGGSITVHSEPNVNTVFTLRF
ncbi:MAG: GHKL domain-containing protein [Candidatus Latescibacteria bacterium]|nr:GHKL domain-containing protein [Candidatus Latescibacterota bacterium]